MEHQKILIILNELNDYKFVRRKGYIDNDESNTNFDVGN